ncbi:MAG: DASS family sodium-coupled anion symporter [Phycisphaerales bacterium]
MTRPGHTIGDTVAWIGLVCGPLFALGAYLALHELDHPARATAAMAVWMATWWLTEAIPLSATALLPLAFLPLAGVADLRAAAGPYANPLILLFFGGFVLGLAMERCDLHRRIALITLRLVGTSPPRLVAGFMLATALMSMWVSNTATALLMLPIAVSVLAQLTDGAPEPDIAEGRRTGANFARCLLLGIAYAASVGGVATLVGTPPNLVLAAFLDDQFGTDLSMARWMLVMVPTAAVFIPLIWLGLTRVIYPIRVDAIPGARELVRDRLSALGPMSRAEWTVFTVFLCTALLWMTRPLINDLGDSVGWAPLASLGDPTIAALAALSLFVIPTNARKRTFAMDWTTAERVPWGILILFGGGLSLAASISTTGLDASIGESMTGLRGVHPLVAILTVTAAVVFLTELTSNTAMATAAMPVLAAAAPAIGVEPERLLIPAAIGASFAFMLPVATPPNAIIFGSGRIRIADMARAGFAFNLLGIVLATAVAYLATDLILPS